VTESPDELVEVSLGDFDSHGVTRARVDHRWIEVEQGVPGEVVSARLTGGKRPQARIAEVLEPAADRVVAPCEYFRDWKCGGCQWQHMSYEGQLRRKREAVDAEMAAAGLDVRVGRVHADDPWRYRSTAGISLGRHAGFRRRASLAIVPIRDCPISHPLIGQLMAALNDGLTAGSIPDFHGRLRLEVRVLQSDRREATLQVMIRPDQQRRPPAGDVEMLVEFLSALSSVEQLALTLITGEIEALKGELFGPVEVAGRIVQLASGSFFQTNLKLLPSLIERLREEAGNVTGKRLADVYGGVGIFGLFLAGGARDVAVIESDPVAIEAGERTAATWGISNVRFLPGRAEDILEGDGPYQVVVLDPPRTGLSEEATTLLIEQRPERILYVSCLAQSLARDLTGFITAGYQVGSLELFDFYPQTYHVELLAVLRASEA
jgi:23S rRNA (uracil1939-C5)-methyltransferase